MLLTVLSSPSTFFFFFNDTATTEIYTLSLHDALPICLAPHRDNHFARASRGVASGALGAAKERARARGRSEEHTSELQSQSNLVCRLLLEKKKNRNNSLLLTRYHKKRRHRAYEFDLPS